MSRALWGSAAGVLLAIAVAAAQATDARPGAVNFVEGQVALAGAPLAAGALETAVVGEGQTLSTEQGRAEVLLTPGAFLRLGDHAAVKMASQAEANPRVELVGGAAVLEVVQLGTGRLEVLDGQARVTIERPGIYAFRAGPPSVSVIVGKARVVENDRASELSKGRELTWGGSGNAAKPARQGAPEEGLFDWSKQRSLAAAGASVNTAQSLVACHASNWHGAGWYWNPFFATWAFLPADYAIPGPYGDTFFSARFYHAYEGAADTHAPGYFTAAE
jgi:hypothetical protein